MIEQVWVNPHLLQDDDDASSDDTVIMDLDGQSGHEPKLADTQIMTDTQVITDINDNTQIIWEVQ